MDKGSSKEQFKFISTKNSSYPTKTLPPLHLKFYMGIQQVLFIALMLSKCTRPKYKQNIAISFERQSELITVVKGYVFNSIVLVQGILIMID